MLRIDTGVQLTVHCYYRVLGYKSEGGTGDTQNNQTLRNSVLKAHAPDTNDSRYLETYCPVAQVTRCLGNLAAAAEAIDITDGTLTLPNWLGGSRR